MNDRINENLKKLKAVLAENWPLLIIIALALFLRFYHLAEYLHFANDEARDAFVIKEMAEHDWWKLAGPATAIGNFNLGPFFYYFLLPFYLIFNFNPVAGGAAVATLDIFTIILIYFFTKKHFSVSAGIIAASLYTTSLWINIYERWGWNPNVLPFFTILVLFLISKIRGSDRRRLGLVITIGALTGLAMQAHAQGIWLFLLLPLVFLLERRFQLNLKKNITRYWKLSVAYLVSFVIVNVPTVIFEIKTGGQNSRAIIDWILSVRESASLADRLTDALTNFFTFTGQAILDQNSIHLALLIFLAPAFYLLLARQGKINDMLTEKRKDFFVLRMMFVLVSLVLLSFFLISEKKYFHFFILLAPVLFITLGFLLAKLYQQSKWYKGGVIALVVLLAIANLSNTFTYWRYLDVGTDLHEFDLPLKDMRQAVDYMVVNSCAEMKVRGEEIDDEKRAFSYLVEESGRNVYWVDEGEEFVLTRDLVAEGERFGRLKVISKQ